MSLEARHRIPSWYFYVEPPFQTKHYTEVIILEILLKVSWSLLETFCFGFLADFSRY